MIRRIPRESSEATAALPLEASRPLTCLKEALDAARREQALRERMMPRLARALTALVGQELALSPAHIRSIVDGELARVRRARAIELHVHPDDRQLLDSTEDMRSRLELAGALRVVEDAQLTRGGCVLITNLGEIDARLETRLELTLEQLANGAFDEP
jgi:flagellar biosynthesis/type III secretory pathway protein FliH